MASLGGVLEIEHARSIAIVNMNGIEPFMCSLVREPANFQLIRGRDSRFGYDGTRAGYDGDTGARR